MELIDSLRGLAERIPELLQKIETEEAAKTALVMPFIQALGYNVFDPTEVVPEFTADVGIKKGEKVDYAVMVDGKPAILFECKWQGGPELKETHMGQLYRYFSVTTARIGVLTNGIVYKFYSDIEDRNKMDARPFLVLDLRHLREQMVAELAQLTKESFDLDQMLSAAGDLKYLREVKAILASELNEPSEDFVRLFFSRVAPGRRLTENVRQEFGAIVKRSFSQFIKERVDQRLEDALSAGRPPSEEAVPTETSASEPEQDDGIETTEEELEAFYLVKSILRNSVDLDRVYYRDTKTYFTVILDDNNRKPICRLWFNGAKKKYISLFDAEKNENKVLLEGLDDIYQHAEALCESARRHAGVDAPSDPVPA